MKELLTLYWNDKCSCRITSFSSKQAKLLILAENLKLLDLDRKKDKKKKKIWKCFEEPNVQVMGWAYPWTWWHVRHMYPYVSYAATCILLYIMNKLALPWKTPVNTMITCLSIPSKLGKTLQASFTQLWYEISQLHRTFYMHIIFEY